MVFFFYLKAGGVWKVQDLTFGDQPVGEDSIEGSANDYKERLLLAPLLLQGGQSSVQDCGSGVLLSRSVILVSALKEEGMNCDSDPVPQSMSLVVIKAGDVW